MSLLSSKFKPCLDNFNSEWKAIAVLIKLYYERFIKLLSYLFILFRVKLFSEMERGWEPSNLRNSKVGCKQFNFHYYDILFNMCAVSNLYVGCICFKVFQVCTIISKRNCLEDAVRYLDIFVTCFKYCVLNLECSEVYPDTSKNFSRRKSIHL